MESTDIKKEYARELLKLAEIYMFNAKILKESLIHKNIPPDSFKKYYKLKYIPLYFLITQSYELIIKSWIVLNLEENKEWTTEKIKKELIRIGHNPALLLKHQLKEQPKEKYKYAILYAYHYNEDPQKIIEGFSEIEKMNKKNFEKLLKYTFIDEIENKKYYNKIKELKEMNKEMNKLESDIRNKTIYYNEDDDFVKEVLNILYSYIELTGRSHPLYTIIQQNKSLITEFFQRIFTEIIEEYNKNKILLTYISIYF